MESKIQMPRLGVNDDYVTLAKWLVDSGTFVKKKQVLCLIETSKETSEITASCDGFITLCAEAGSDIEVGDVVAVLGDEAINRKMDDNNMPEYKITEKAKALIREYNVDITVFDRSRLIKERDVLKLISKPREPKETKNNQVLIYGGGGLGKMAVDILKTRHELNIYGLIDKSKDVKDIMGIKSVGSNEDLDRLFAEGYRQIVNCVGFLNKAHYRRPIYEMLKEKGFIFPNVIHRSAIIEQSAVLGEGNMVMAGAIIGSDVKVESNCIINSGAIISHGCIIGSHCHITSGAVLAGDVIVGENTLIGQGVTVYIGVKIGRNVVIQNGCHIFKDIPDDTVILLKDNS